MTDFAKKISLDAKALGLKDGDAVLVHSSLKSLGEGVAPLDVIDGLVDAVGRGGTVVFPALSYLNCNKENPFFDYFETKSNIGAIPEYFRTSYNGVLRSINPTHSCCACGANADYIVSGHKCDVTPCGNNSPFKRLAMLDGKILFIGCGMKPNTSMHAVEELVVPCYLFGDDVEYTVRDKDGVESRAVCRSHKFKGVTQRYDRLADILAGDELLTGKILSADCHVVQAGAMWKKAEEKLRQDPLYFIDKVDDLM